MARGLVVYCMLIFTGGAISSGLAVAKGKTANKEKRRSDIVSQKS